MSYTDEQKIGLDIYRIAIEQFREHPRIYWARNRFFATLQAGLLAFSAFNVRDSSSIGLADVVLAGIGLVLAVIWFAVMFASSELISNWKKIILDLEQELFQSTNSTDQTSSSKMKCKQLFHQSDSMTSNNGWLSITQSVLIMIGAFCIAWFVLLVHFISSLYS